MIVTLPLGRAGSIYAWPHVFGPLRMIRAYRALAVAIQCAAAGRHGLKRRAIRTMMRESITYAGFEGRRAFAQMAAMLEGYGADRVVLS